MKDLVSAIMVTKDRLPLVRRALQCFQAQRYAARELIIVSDADDGTKELVQAWRDPRIRHIVPPTTGATLGELRNFGIRQARGEFIAQWDDDDWYHPERLSAQVELLQNTAAEICLLHRWTLAWPERNLFAYSAYYRWEGSLVARRANLPEYPPLARGEDSQFILRCEDRHLTFCLLDRPELYIYVVHQKNTHDAQHFAECVFAKLTEELGIDETIQVKRALGLLPPAASP